ncbi:Tubulin polyglutamylase ttll6 [Thoreauomyces humboldtii]|nr:Tubulin polyglutamylase ttll6 [Thoreauomyces humboldtii]
MHEICRKDCLARNLGRLNRSFPKDGNFFPRTWVLPLEWGDLKAAHNASRKRPCYIVKPDHGCQGKGISLLSTPDALIPMIKALKGASSLIVQTYLPRPCLIDSYKFDLRVYVLVTSVKPLRVFLFKDGLARFATEPYREPKESNLDNVCMHLTNYAINKNSENFDHAPEEGKGSKRSIKSVLRHLADLRGAPAVDRCWRRIGDVVVKTLLTIQPQLSRNMQACFPTQGAPRARPGDVPSDAGETPNSTIPPLKSRTIQSSQCFEILGFDIFLDHKLKPWVLEVNHSPSFTCDSPLDAEIKRAVIRDALTLLNIRATNPKRFHFNQKRKAKKRLMAVSGVISAPSPTPAPSPVVVASTAENKSPRGMPTPTNFTTIQLQTPPETSAETSPDASLPATPDLSDDAIEAIARYDEEYPPHELSKLAEFEDAHLGQYQRIYPPVDRAKLSHFLLLQKEAANIFSETVSTKRRREFLQNKKKEEQLKQQKIDDWRARQKEKTRSMPSLSFSTRTAPTTGADGSSTPRGTTRVRPKSTLGSLIFHATAAEQASQLRSRSESTLAQQQQQQQGKQTIKLNVESINDRFVRSMYPQHSEPLSVRLSSTPASSSSSSIASTSTGHSRPFEVGPVRGRPTKQSGFSLNSNFNSSTSLSDASNPRLLARKIASEICREPSGNSHSTPDPREAFDRYEFIQRMQSALQELQKSRKAGSTAAGSSAAIAAGRSRVQQRTGRRSVP